MENYMPCTTEIREDVNELSPEEHFGVGDLFLIQESVRKNLKRLKREGVEYMDMFLTILSIAQNNLIKYGFKYN